MRFCITLGSQPLEIGPYECVHGSFIGIFLCVHPTIGPSGFRDWRFIET